MQKRTILPILTMSMLTFGVLAGGPAHAAAGPDPNESGVTETADLPEAPEAPEAPESAPDAEDTGAAEPTAPAPSDAANPPPAVNPPAPAAVGGPTAPGSPAAKAQGSSRNGRDQARPTGLDRAVPANAVPTAAALPTDDGTDVTPWVIAGGIGLVVGAAGAAALGRRHLTAARLESGQV
jgi:hypothetical protein